MGLKLIIFGSDTCRITSMMLPVFHQVKREIAAQGLPVEIRYVNARLTPYLNYQWGVRATPTYFLVDDSRIYTRMQGMMTAQELMRVITSLAGAWRGAPRPR